MVFNDINESQQDQCTANSTLDYRSNATLDVDALTK